MLTSLSSKYTLQDKIGEGSFSEVFKVKDKKTGQFFAAKRLYRSFENIDEVNDYEELKILHKLTYHQNIAHIMDFVYEPTSRKLTLIFNLMDQSLYDYIRDKKTRLPETRCKNYLYQLGHGIFYLHNNGIYHRDIKPENCLLRIDPILAKSNPLKAEIVQIGDLGSLSHTSYPLPRTEYVSTRWYRSPECLLAKGYYGPKMDIWALGCVFYEIFTLSPLFPGENQLDQLDKIHCILGSPSKQLLERFKHYDSSFTFPKHKAVSWHNFIPRMSIYGIDVLKSCLAYHPDQRMSAEKLLQHPYFYDLKNKVCHDTVTARMLYTLSDSIATKKPAQPRKQTKCDLSLTRNTLRNKLYELKEKLHFDRDIYWSNSHDEMKRRLNNNLKSIVTSNEKGDE